LSEIFVEYWYAIVGALIAVVALWFLFRPGTAKRPRILGWMMFGPFWPLIDGYLTRRGGFTRRELIGWAIVLLVMVLAAIFAPRRGI
jgi:hypothetical protein